MIVFLYVFSLKPQLLGSRGYWRTALYFFNSIYDLYQCNFPPRSGERNNFVTTVKLNKLPFFISWFQNILILAVFWGVFGTSIRLRLQIFFAIIGNCAVQEEQNVLLCARSPGQIHVFSAWNVAGFVLFLRWCQFGQEPYNFSLCSWQLRR